MEEQLEQLELSIKEASTQVNKMEAMERLVKNKDFIALFTEGYFEKEASRLVLLLAAPAMQGEQEQKSLYTEMTAISHLRQYICTTFQLGRMAKKALLEDEETHAELLNEGAT